MGRLGGPAPQRRDECELHNRSCSAYALHATQVASMPTPARTDPLYKGSIVSGPVNRARSDMNASSLCVAPVVGDDMTVKSVIRHVDVIPPSREFDAPFTDNFLFMVLASPDCSLL